MWSGFSIEGETGERVVLVHEIEKHCRESDMTEVVSRIRRAVADEYELEIHHVVLDQVRHDPKNLQRKNSAGCLQSRL